VLKEKKSFPEPERIGKKLPAGTIASQAPTGEKKIREPEGYACP